MAEDPNSVNKRVGSPFRYASPVQSAGPSFFGDPLGAIKRLLGMGAQAERIQAAPMPSQSPENTWDAYGFSGKNKPK